MQAGRRATPQPMVRSDSLSALRLAPQINNHSTVSSPLHARLQIDIEVDRRTGSARIDSWSPVSCDSAPAAAGAAYGQCRQCVSSARRGGVLSDAQVSADADGSARRCLTPNRSSHCTQRWTPSVISNWRTSATVDGTCHICRRCRVIQVYNGPTAVALGLPLSRV